MTPKEFIKANNIPDIFHYAASEEKNFEMQASETGYTRISTFYSDLSIAEVYGEKSIRDTYNNVVKSWLKNCKMFTEFVMSLNWKCWCWYYRGNSELSKLYAELFEQARDKGYEKYKGEDLSYFWSTLD